MKSLTAFLVSLYSIFVITALITHVWTVIIAFQESGIIGGILTLLMPVLAELYWMFKMFGENDTYAYIALTQLVLGFFISIATSSQKG